MKKLLLVGNPYHDYIDAVAAGFEKNGYRVTLIKIRFHPPFLKHIPVLNRIIGGMIDGFYRKRIMRYLHDFSQDYDIAVFFGLHIFNIGGLEKIRKVCSHLKSVFWHIDSIYAYDPGLSISGYFDYLLCYNAADADYLVSRGKKALFVPLAFDPEWYFPIPGSEKEWDLYFIGSLRPRIEKLDRIARRLRDMNLRFRIDGRLSPVFVWKNKRKYPDFFRHYTGRMLNHPAINEMYNRSKLCLNLQPAQATTGFSIRTYEVLGAGGHQLTDGNRELLEALFTGHDRIVHFDGLDELAGKIEKFLNGSGKEEKAPPGDDRLVELAGRHTYEHRAKEILAFLET
jgi:spore maturation protein CgeB